MGPACASALASDPLAPPELSIWAPLNPKRCLFLSSLPASSTALGTTCLPQFLVFLPGTELGWAGPWEPLGLVRWGWDRENPKIGFALCRPLLLFPGAQISGPRRGGNLHPLWGQGLLSQVRRLRPGGDQFLPSRNWELRQTPDEESKAKDSPPVSPLEPVEAEVQKVKGPAPYPPTPLRALRVHPPGSFWLIFLFTCILGRLPKMRLRLLRGYSWLSVQGSLLAVLRGCQRLNPGQLTSRKHPPFVLLLQPHSDFLGVLASPLSNSLGQCLCSCVCSGQWCVWVGHSHRL